MSTRLADASNITEFQKNALTFHVFCDINLLSGHTYLHDGLGDIVTAGHTWKGVGSFGEVSGLSEGNKDIARSWTLKLSGIEPALINSVLNEIVVEREVILYTGGLDARTGQLVGALDVLAVGYIDAPSVQMGRDCSITLTMENPIRKEPLVSMLTSEDQRLIDPNDTYFDQLPNIPNAVGEWGLHSTSNWVSDTWANYHS